MKINVDDPRLTAYALGELSATESAIIREALKDDAALKSQFEQTQGLAALLSGSLLRDEVFELGAERREEIHHSGRRPDAKVLVMEHRRRSRWQSFAVVAGVAAVVVFGFYLLSETTVESVTSKTVVADSEESGEVVQKKGAVASDVTSPAKVVSPHLQEGFKAAISVSDELIIVTERTAVEVPLVGRVNLARLQRKLESDEGAAVRAEELVNTPNYEVNPAVKLENVGISAEMGPCPWNAGAQLLMVTFRDLKTDGITPQVNAQLLLDAPRVASVKRVTSGTVRGQSTDRQSLTDGKSAVALYEVTLRHGEGRFAALDLTVNERSAFLPIFESNDVEASLDFQIASVLARFAMWSCDRQASDVQLIASDAQKLLAEVSGTSARYALDLIVVTAESLK